MRVSDLGMFDFAVVAFILTFLGFLCLVIAGAPMVGAAERQHGLKAAQDDVKRLRSERASGRGAAEEVVQHRDAAAANLSVMKAELKSLRDEMARLPKQSYELTFELGTPDPGMQAFLFVVSRNMSNQETSSLSAPERTLWKFPRATRVWARNQATAQAAAEKRFRQPDGFTVRVAEQIRTARAASGD